MHENSNEKILINQTFKKNSDNKIAWITSYLKHMTIYTKNEWRKEKHGNEMWKKLPLLCSKF
jgi:hypothetical protein